MIQCASNAFCNTISSGIWLGLYEITSSTHEVFRPLHQHIWWLVLCNQVRNLTRRLDVHLTLNVISVEGVTP